MGSLTRFLNSPWHFTVQVPYVTYVLSMHYAVPTMKHFRYILEKIQPSFHNKNVFKRKKGCAGFPAG